MAHMDAGDAGIISGVCMASHIYVQPIQGIHGLPSYLKQPVCAMQATMALAAGATRGKNFLLGHRLSLLQAGRA